MIERGYENEEQFRENKMEEVKNRSEEVRRWKGGE
jgi:hypothetical protein